MEQLFTQPDSWSGGNVDALMYFGAANIDDANLVARSLWSFPRLKGPYALRNVEPDQQVPIPVPVMSEDDIGQLIGVYTNHDGTKSNLAHTTILDDDGLWVYAGLTVGSLPAEWDVGAYPFDDGKPINWLPPLFDDLRIIADHISKSTPICAATYGWLTAMDCNLLLEVISGQIPEDRWGPIEIWRDGHRSYFPTTQFEAPMRASEGGIN